jgi:cytochrome c oxidase cbb3-type subunit 1
MQGSNWIAGAPFVQSVTDMMPYWLWRAVGGTLMFLSHIVFAWNVWAMRPRAGVTAASRAATAAASGGMS